MLVNRLIVLYGVTRVLTFKINARDKIDIVVIVIKVLIFLRNMPTRAINHVRPTYVFRVYISILCTTYLLVSTL